MLCIKCNTLLTIDNRSASDHRYCNECWHQRSSFISERRRVLASLREMNLDAKIIQTRFLIRQAVTLFGLEKVYISYSGGKDSTVLSHIAKSMYPNILHIFANTTNEYPETIAHIQWEQKVNNTNLIIVNPIDAKGEIWTFKKVVEQYGYPMFSKRVANAIRTYQHALTPRTKANAADYINRNFKKYERFKELPISDKCCDRLKKWPIKHKAKELGLECAILGILASESYQREKDWIENGCNVFYERKDNQSRPLSFWTDSDILEYIQRYNVRIPEIYKMGYSRNGCMYCGFGVQLESSGKNRFQLLKETHPIQYKYFESNFGNLISEFDILIE